jgi:hypothetical protein
MACDSAILSTAHAYEPVSLAAVESWFASIGKPMYTVGPLMPPNLRASAEETEADAGFKTFLDGMEGKYGSHSVIFVGRNLRFPFQVALTLIRLQISFGTVFWPTAHEYIDELVEALLEKQAPFVRYLPILHRTLKVMCLPRSSATPPPSPKSPLSWRRESRTRASGCSRCGPHNSLSSRTPCVAPLSFSAVVVYSFIYRQLGGSSHTAGTAGSWKRSTAAFL